MSRLSLIRESKCILNLFPWSVNIHHGSLCSSLHTTAAIKNKNKTSSKNKHPSHPELVFNCPVPEEISWSTTKGLWFYFYFYLKRDWQADVASHIDGLSWNVMGYVLQKVRQPAWTRKHCNMNITASLTLLNICCFAASRDLPELHLDSSIFFFFFQFHRTLVRPYPYGDHLSHFFIY